MIHRYLQQYCEKIVDLAWQVPGFGCAHDWILSTLNTVGLQIQSDGDKNILDVGV